MCELSTRAIPGLVLFALSCGNLAAQDSLWDGVEAYYSFDQDMVTDISGFDRNLSVVDVDPDTELSLSTDVPALVGGVGSLNAMGTEDFLEAIDWSGIGGAGDRTVAGWVKTENQSKTYHLMEWGTNSAGQRWTFRVNNNAGNGTQGGLRVEIQGGFIISEGFLADGEWHHVAATFTNDGSPDVEDVLLYIDGQQSNVAPPTPNPEPLDTLPDQGIVVGASRAFANRGAEALIDEMVVFSRVLSPEEIGQLALGATLGERVMRGDFNADGVVNRDDFNVLRDNMSAQFAGSVTYSMGDYNLDGVIDLFDFAGFKADFPGALGGAVGVPEPASIGLALLAVGTLLPLVRVFHMDQS